MLAIPSRHRSLTLLAGVVIAQVLLLAVQIRNKEGVRLIRAFAVTLFSFVQEPAVAVIDRVGSTWQGYVSLRHTREENQQLRAEIAELRMRTARLESRAAEADRLTALLGFRDRHSDASMIIARVIGASAVGSNMAMYVNRGEADGVRKNMGVITPEGVVGKVLDIYPHTAQVLLLTDKESGVGALLAGSRTQGVVRGTGEPEATMQYVVNDERVAAGDRILTSGQDRIFPKDLPLGTVAGTKPGSQFQTIRVKPAARLDRLEEVLILPSRQELVPKEPVAGTAAGLVHGAAPPS